MKQTSRYGLEFDDLADRWASIEAQHNLIHPDRGECGGVGGCPMMAAADDLRESMIEELETWWANFCTPLGKAQNR